MRSAKVKALAVSGINKKVYRSGDVVKEVNFERDQFDKYLKSGHLELEKPPTVESIKKELAKANSKTEVDAIIEGDKRDSVKKAGEARILAIREEAEAAAKKADEERLKKLNADRLEKIPNAETVEAVTAIVGYSEDEAVKEAGEARIKVLNAEADKAAKEAAEKEAAEKAAAEEAKLLESIAKATTVPQLDKIIEGVDNEKVLEAASAKSDEIKKAAEKK